MNLKFLTEVFSFDFPTPWLPHPVITLNNFTAGDARAHTHTHKRESMLKFFTFFDSEIVTDPVIKGGLESYIAHMLQTEGGASTPSLLV